MAKDYEKLSLSNEFVFGKVMENDELCRELLGTLVQTDIASLQQSAREKEIRFKMDTKPVRLDIYVKDRNDILYDTEMQNKNGKSLEYLALPKRSRYYQSVMDSEILKKGVHYRYLNESYVIFICTFDPFGKGQYVYTFCNICKENTDLQLEDKTTKIFFNTKSQQKNIPENIRNLFNYIENGVVNNALTKKLDNEVNRLRNDEKWWGEYMRSLTWEMDVREEGRVIGCEEGRDSLLTEQVHKKLQKGKSKEQIAEELETTTEEIEKVLAKNELVDTSI